MSTVCLCASESPVKPVLVRQLIGESLREERVAQARTLREVSKAAQVSLATSRRWSAAKRSLEELLAAICAALDLPLSAVLNVVSEKMALHEQISAGERVRSLPTVRGPWPRPLPNRTPHPNSSRLRPSPRTLPRS